MNVNVAIIGGNLASDPQLKEVGATKACDFTVACNRRWKAADGTQKEKCAFIRCTAWGRQAELIADRLRKGEPIFVEGELEQDEWTDKNGVKQSKTKIRVKEFQFMGRPPAAAAEPEPAPAVPAPARAAPVGDAFDEPPF